MHSAQRTMHNAQCKMQLWPGPALWAVCIVHFALCVSPVVATAEIIDRVLAVVGGVVITQSDVTAAFDLGLATAGPTDDPMAVVLSQLIDRQLMLTEVDRYAPPEPAKEAIDLAVQQVRGRFATTQAYDRALARSGIEQGRLRQTLRDQLRIRAYLDQRFTVPPPNDNELGGYYRDHPELFSRGGQVVAFDGARPEIAVAFIASRRATLINDWVSGLRRRADVSNLSVVRR
jgi:hypothetical protein